MARPVDKLKMPPKKKSAEEVDDMLGGMGEEGEEHEAGESKDFEAGEDEEAAEGGGEAISDLTTVADEDLIAEIKARGIEHLLDQPLGDKKGKVPQEAMEME